MRFPDALYRAQRDPGGLGHHAAGPMCRLSRRLLERQLDYPVDGGDRQRREAGLASLVAQEAGHALAHEALLPSPDTRLGLAGPARDLDRATSVHGGQDDPGPPNMLLAAVPVGHDRLQPGAVGDRYFYGDPFAHASSIARPPCDRYLTIASDH
jgi:hypothetical protein